MKKLANVNRNRERDMKYNQEDNGKKKEGKK